MEQPNYYSIGFGELKLSSKKLQLCRHIDAQKEDESG